MKKSASVMGFIVLVCLVVFAVSRDPAYLASKHKIEKQLSNASSVAISDSLYEQNKLAKADKLLSFAKGYLGRPYLAGGQSPKGFDCSGFTHFIFTHLGYKVPPGSVNQAMAGRRVALNQLQKGDLLIFTGTNLSVRKPGHVGIVMYSDGKEVRFIHSSSNGGVKLSELTQTRYADRLLEVRRIL